MNPLVHAAAASRLSFIATLAVAAALTGCAQPASLVQGPVSVRPAPQPTYAERTVTGGIYRPSLNNVSLFSDRSKPQAIGDTIKIDISETLSASNKLNSTNSRSNSVSSKGPGMSSDSLGDLIKGLANMNATASGNDTFTGKGNTTNTQAFSARIAAYVVNVLPNGYLAVAGERSLAFNGNRNTLRFSGVVNPNDIKAGGIVASADVVDAKMELIGVGANSEAAQRTWLQKILTDGLSVW